MIILTLNRNTEKLSQEGPLPDGRNIALDCIIARQNENKNVSKVHNSKAIQINQ